MSSEGTPAGLEVGKNWASLGPEEAEFLNLTPFPDPGVQRVSGRRTGGPEASPEGLAQLGPSPLSLAAPPPASASGNIDLNSGGHTDRLLQVTMDPEGDISLPLSPCLPYSLLPVPLPSPVISTPPSSLKTPFPLRSLLNLLPNLTSL